MLLELVQVPRVNGIAQAELLIDPGVDSHDLAVGVDQRTATVARGNFGVVLNP